MVECEVVPSVKCPINILVTLIDCKKCPYHEKHNVSLRTVSCLYEAKKLKAEMSVIKEPVTRW